MRQHNFLQQARLSVLLRAGPEFFNEIGAFRLEATFRNLEAVMDLSAGRLR